MSKAENYEEIVENLLFRAGLKFSRDPQVRSSHPVKDKHGQVRKTVTTPDFEVYDPDERESLRRKVYLEVTSGSGHTAHKRAQRRVIAASGYEGRYSVLDALTIEDLLESASRLPTNKFKKVFKNKVNWDK